MFERLARSLIRRRRRVLVAAGVFIVVAGALGGSVADSLSRDGFDDPGAESTLARQRLEHEFGAGLPGYVLVVTATGGQVDDPAVVFGLSMDYEVFLLSSGLTFLKQYGLGLTIAVLLDAFVIRATLVPAVMKLAGNANWWAPRRLRRLHDVVGLGRVHAPADAG